MLDQTTKRNQWPYAVTIASGRGRGTPVEQRNFFPAKCLAEKVTDESRDQVQIVQHNRSLGKSVLTVEEKRHIAEARVGDLRRVQHHGVGARGNS